MINDPYKVLGLEPDASADDIKKAYRQMAKTYHPDLHPNDPSITEKMNEINEAYDMLTNPAKYAAKRAQEEATEEQEWEAVSEPVHTPQTNTLARPVVQPEDSTEIAEAVNYLNQNQFQMAVDVLTRIPSKDRDARWYYLSSLGQQMLGNYMPAAELIHKAAQMEPQNQMYQQILMQFLKAAQTYEAKPNKGFPFSPVLLLFVILGYFLGKFIFGQG